MTSQPCVLDAANTDESTLGSTSSAPSSLQRVALAVVIFLSIGAWGFIQPLIPLYLAESGLSRWQIGLVSGLGTGLALLAQPLWGRWSDRLDARRPFMIGVALLSSAAYFAFSWVRSPLAFTLLTALGVNGFLYLQAAAGVLAGRLSRAERGGSSYAGFRFWGSAGYLVVAMSAGLLLQNKMGAAEMSRADLAAVMPFAPLLFLMAALVSCWVPDPKRASSDVEIESGSNTLPPQLRAFLVAFALYNFALYGMFAYLSLYLKELKATPMLVQGTWAAGVVAEMIVMTQSGRISDRLGRRPLLAIPFFALPLRLLLLISATGGWWVLAVQCMEGLCFGVMGILSVTLVNDLANDRNRGILQSRLICTIGLSMALSPIAAGWLASFLDLRSLFAILAVIAMLGTMVFWRAVEETHPRLKLRGQSTL